MRSLKKGQLLLSIMLIVSVSFLQAMVPLSVNTETGPPETPIVVSLELGQSRGSGGTLEVTCSVSSQSAINNVRVKIFSGGGVKPVSQNSWLVNLAAKSTTTYKTTFSLNQPGNKKITCSALEAAGKKTRWGDDETSYFNVSAGGIRAGWVTKGNVAASNAKLLPATSALETAAAPEFSMPMAPGDRPQDAVNKRACETKLYYGRWYFYDRGTYLPPDDPTTTVSRGKMTLRPLPYAYVRLYNASTNAQIGSTAFTDENGRWEVCTSQVASVRSKVFMQSNWKAVSTDGSNTTSKIYNWQTSSLSGSNSNLGSWYVPNNSTNLLAAWSYNDLNKATYFFYERYGYKVGPFIRSIIKWTPSSTDGTHYHLGNDQIHLKGNDPRTPDSALHEWGHFLMDKLYGDTFWPSGYGGCPSPHYYNGVSNRDCAWSEGWANAVDLMVKNDPLYRWPSGSTANNETRSGFAAGDKVEGNVAATFWDWLDNANEGSGSATDKVQLSLDRFLQTINVYNNNTFNHYWTSWKSYREWCGPVLAALKLNINTTSPSYVCP